MVVVAGNKLGLFRACRNLTGCVLPPRTWRVFVLLFTAGDHTVVSSQGISIHIYIFVCLAVIFELLLRDLESMMFTQTSVWPLYPSCYPFVATLMIKCVFISLRMSVLGRLCLLQWGNRGRGTQDVAAITAIQLVSDWNWAACLGGLLSGVKARGVSRAQRRQTITNFQDEARVQHLNK